MSDAFQTPAPGAKAAKVCGILAIIFALTCVGIPVAMVLGIVAIVKQARAKRQARLHPDLFAPVPATGLVTGILGLVLPILMIPTVGLVGAVAIPAFLAQRERAREFAVRANLEAARRQVEFAMLDLQTRTPSQVPSQESILRALSRDPLILALRNPFTPSAPAFQRGTAGPLGTVMVYADEEDVGGNTIWSIQFRARVRKGGRDRTLQGDVISHHQAYVRGRTGAGRQVVQPPAEAPPPGRIQPQAQVQPQGEANR